MKYSNENIAFDAHLNWMGLAIFGMSSATLKSEYHLISIIILIGTLMMLFSQKHPTFKKKKFHKTNPVKSFSGKLKLTIKFFQTLFDQEKDIIINGQVRKFRPFIFGYAMFIAAFSYHIIKFFEIF